MKREERARIVCQRVAERIHEIAPPGLGSWGPAWDLVAEASDAFLDALSGWLDEDTPERRQELQAAADALVRAWCDAGERWREEEGQPARQELAP